MQSLSKRVTQSSLWEGGMSEDLWFWKNDP